MIRPWVFRASLAGVIALAMSPLVLGQAFNIKPGLWETSAQSSVGGAPDMSAMAKGDAGKMTPDQAAALAAAMNGGRGGAQRPVTTRKCWTEEQIAKHEFQDRNDPSCKQTVVSSSAMSLELKIECTGDRASTGTLRLTAVDSEHVNGAIAMKMTGGQMAGMSMNSTFTSKRISADCGDVK